MAPLATQTQPMGGARVKSTPFRLFSPPPNPEVLDLGFGQLGSPGSAQLVRGLVQRLRNALWQDLKGGAGRGLRLAAPPPSPARGRANRPASGFSRPWGRVPQATQPPRPERLPAGVGAEAPGYSLVRPHGGFRGEQAGRPPALLRVGGPAGGDRGPRLQLLENLLPPRPASGGGGRAAGPGPAHRGGSRAPGEAQFGPADLGGLAQETD